MSWYVIRMEQLAIGAALTGREPAEAIYLRSADFVHDSAYFLYSTIGHYRDQHPDWTPGQVLGAIAALPYVRDTLHVTGTALAATADLATEAGQADLTAAYRQLLATGIHNEIDRHVDNIRYRPSDGRELDILQRAYGQLGEAVARRTQTLAWLEAGIDHLGDEMLQRWDQQWPRPIAQPHHPYWRHTETIVLSGLMQHPQTAWTFGSLIDTGTFSTPLHRDTFEAICQQAAGAHHRLSAGDVQYQLERNRHLRLAETAATVTGPHAELSHLEDLASGAAYTPAETAAAVRDLITWHTTTAAHSHANIATTAQPELHIPAATTGNATTARI